MTAIAPQAASPADAPKTLEQLATDVQRTLDDVRGMPIDQRTRALALKEAVEAFHKAGLITIVKALKAHPQGNPLLLELVDDPGVFALFSLHGIVRSDVRTRVARVIENLRPYTQSHGGDVTLVDISEDTVYVKLSGACNGCSMSSVTLRNGVESALKEHVPEITRIEVVANTPEESAAAAAPALVSLSRAPKNDEWIDGPLVSQLSTSRPFRVDLPEGRSLVLLLVGTDVKAYWNECAHLGLAIDGGMIDREHGTITCPWHGFSYDCASGECLSAPQAQLEPVPARLSPDGRVQLRPVA
jgi:Fe-S cluster biogenesis protein NfuA/nitrite reductase/ring-hydroxylating ferredoxin subunit